jgi:hypothetical protein
VSVSQAFPPLGQEYEPFLYAIVCNEGNGMPLTVVSAIERSGADPWKEAARIAKMPKMVALDALARMIPERTGADGVVIANRLFALLPLGRENKINSIVGAKIGAPRWSPLVPVMLVLLLGLALVFAFRMMPHVDAGQHESPSSAPIADKVDP